MIGNNYEQSIYFEYFDGDDTIKTVPPFFDVPQVYIDDLSMQGIQYIVLGMLATHDQFTQANGFFPDVTLDYFGIDPVDPRVPILDRYTRARNPALQIRDYVLNENYGFGQTTTTAFDQSIIDAADYFDEEFNEEYYNVDTDTTTAITVKRRSPTMTRILL